MKKKTLFMIPAIALTAFSMNAYAADIENMTLEELKAAYMELEAKYNELAAGESSSEDTEGSGEDFVYSCEGFTYKYLKNEIKNIDGIDYLYVFFDYTNDSGETSVPYYSLTVSAFQEGIEMTPYASFDEGIPEADKAFKEIKTGTTTDIALKYELYSDAPVSLEISPMITFGDEEIGEYEFELNK